MSDVPKRSDTELEEIKKHDKKLYQDVVLGKISRKDAHNKIMSDVNMVGEYKGRGTRNKPIGLKKDMEILEKRYKIKLDDWADMLMELYPFTFQNRIKEKKWNYMKEHIVLKFNINM